MRFFLNEIVARVVAIYLCVDLSRKLWHGLVERKIGYVVSRGDLLDLLLDWVDWSKLVIQRDTAPIRYWIQIGLVAFTLFASLVVAIFGWWQPDT
jgi:hypothetical protein